MARFYFTLDECGEITKDVEGREFPDLRQAKSAAILDARSIMCQEIGNGALCMSCHIDITNEQSERLARVTFKDALKVTGI